MREGTPQQESPELGSPSPDSSIKQDEDVYDPDVRIDTDHEKMSESSDDLNENPYLCWLTKGGAYTACSTRLPVETNREREGLQKNYPVPVQVGKDGRGHTIFKKINYMEGPRP